MLYVNQQDYPHIPYRTNLKEPDSAPAREGTAATSACGPCSAMMMVDRLTLQSLSLEEALRIAVDSKANMDPGTDMKIYGPLIAEKFGLVMTTTNDENEMAACLQNGGCAIINVGGNHDDYEGVLSDVGHYVLAFAYENGRFVILDPAYRKGKYDVEVPSRAGKVEDRDKILYVKAEVLAEDTATRDPGYYLFRRK